MNNRSKSGGQDASCSLPQPVKTDSRICFGIEYFDNETDADRFAIAVRERGDTYNGGWLHGMRCGRDKSFDHIDADLGQLYAVTVA
jgi:hypothetical protein